MAQIKERLRDWSGNPNINFVESAEDDREIDFSVNAVRDRNTGRLFFLGELDVVLITVDTECRATVEINSAASIHLKDTDTDVTGPMLKLTEIQ